MNRVLLACLLLLSAGATAQVFKWVDADGRTQFSDRPQPDSQPTGVPSRKPSGADGPVPPGAATVVSPVVAAATSAQLGPYKAFEIASPEANQTLRQTEDKLGVSLLLDPPLMQGHQIELVMDGTPMPVDRATGTQLSLGGLSFGSHQAYARIQDALGAVIASTPVVTFHLRKPIPPGVLP